MESTGCIPTLSPFKKQLASLITSEVSFIYSIHSFLPKVFHFLILFTKGVISQFLKEEN